MKSIDIFNLMNISNPRIIDIRDNYKYSLGSIPGSINVPYLFLVTNPGNYMNKKEKYYLLCDSGRTVDYGYDVVNVDGGYNAYLRYKEKT